MHILLTGATGLVGQYLVRDLLLAGKSLAVLIRAQEKTSAPRRLEKIMAHWDRKLGRRLPRPVCLEGEITSSGLGLSAEARRWVAKNCQAMLHNAASLT